MTVAIFNSSKTRVASSRYTKFRALDKREVEKLFVSLSGVMDLTQSTVH